MLGTSFSIQTAGPSGYDEGQFDTRKLVKQ